MVIFYYFLLFCVEYYHTFTYANNTNVNITMNDHLVQSTRADSLRVRLYAAKKTIKWAAAQLGISREWLSKVLNEIEESETLLDRLENLIEQEDQLLAA